MAHPHTHVVHFSDCPGASRCRCETRRYARVLGMALVILALEVIGGWLSGSLALLADAGHVSTDMSAITVSIVVAELARANFRVRGVGFWINVVLLALVALGIMHETIDRWQHPREVTSWLMLCVATLGGMGNWLQHRALGGHSHNKTMRVLNLHILADLATSVGVVGASIAIWITGMYRIDTVVSFLIACWIGLQVAMLAKNPDGHGHHH